ncbi:class I SAM-dependent methyltransferase [Salinispira pacifica]|uniref:Putative METHYLTRANSFERASE (METHYLASE) n=1 Tax=Salinispira pacifica TaxID=1307761 RepID=V5WE17_9SPIO|nr:class I SAM-dependent methyltransferase [Salinispira pacifica]AHC14017.1 putative METHYLTRANSFERASE (METHYLASE) [Salinispira pacifica]
MTEEFGRPIDGNIEVASGHWVLASLGKKVLRPGGIKLSRTMLRLLSIDGRDDVVEFAPGLGATARHTLGYSPRSYTGVDKTPEVVEIINREFDHPRYICVEADASNTGLEDESASVLYAEAMLTIQTDTQKLAIMKEAARCLRTGGRFAIHEIYLCDDQPNEIADAVRSALTGQVRHPVRPVRIGEWRLLLEEAGFRVREIRKKRMKLLQPLRVISDEGLLPAIRFFTRAMKNPAARKRVSAMRSAFQTHHRHMGAVLFICEKL